MSILRSFNVQLCICLILAACGAAEKQEPPSQPAKYTLDDFYADNIDLDLDVDSIFSTLLPEEKIGQMIITSAGDAGKPSSVVENLIRKKAIGGVLMLSGTKEQITGLTHRFDSLASASGMLPLLYSADAEPSLINRKIKGTNPVSNTIDLKSPEKTRQATVSIANDLIEMGIHLNFAPVVDLSPDNAAITNRTFGVDSAQVVTNAIAFIETSNKMNIATTAKHFPGHGLVSGDTHNRLVTIDGPLRELGTYLPLMEHGVLSVMVGHIAVINNNLYQTDGLPSSCSRTIVTDLLRKGMGFRGIIVTDAMNMGALKNIENAALKAVMAGCDMVLMEPNEERLLQLVLQRYLQQPETRAQVDHSVRRILRLKLCLNLI